MMRYSAEDEIRTGRGSDDDAVRDMKKKVALNVSQHT